MNIRRVISAVFLFLLISYILAPIIAGLKAIGQHDGPFFYPIKLHTPLYSEAYKLKYGEQPVISEVRAALYYRPIFWGLDFRPKSSKDRDALIKQMRNNAGDAAVKDYIWKNIGINNRKSRSLLEGDRLKNYYTKLRAKEKEVLESFDPLPQMINEINNIDVFTLYEGLPHQVWEETLLESELEAKKTVTQHEFPFYEAPNILEIKDRISLKNLMLDSQTFERVKRFNGCGIYHPDFAFHWKDEPILVEIQICFGCNVVKAFMGNLTANCGLSDSAEASFKEILNRYNIQRPKEN